MNRRMILTLALGLSLLLPLVGSDSAVQAQSAGRRVADTGIVSLGPGQFLRVTVASGSRDDVRVRFRWFGYSQSGCNQGVCALSIASQFTGDLMTLAPGEAFIFDVPNAENARVTVSSNSRDVRINAHVVDATTSQIIVVCIS